MIYLIVSFFAALAVAISVYIETASFGFAFLAYSLTGTLVMITALLAPTFGPGEDEVDERRHA